MIDGNTVLAIIPARGSSKGVLRKNIREVAGKPLIAWTIEEAKSSKYVDRVILSSEDEEIIQVAGRLGCEVPFVRPTELARDDTPGIAPVLHAIETLAENYDYIVLLQPTSPSRKAEDIDACIEFCLKRNAPACVSVTEPVHNPYWMFQVNRKGEMTPVIKSDSTFSRRQSIPTIYAVNGAVYVAKKDWLEKTKTFISDETVAYPMPKERSLDIDSEFDLRVFTCLVSQDS